MMELVMLNRKTIPSKLSDLDTNIYAFEIS